MKKYLTLLLLVVCGVVEAQNIELNSSERFVKSSGDVVAVALPLSALATTLILKDYQGTKQLVFSGVATVGVTYAFKYLIDKERPDGSNLNSFPSAHSSVSFVSAGFLGKRYGWKFAVPAYALATYVGASRVYSHKHDVWDVVSGAALGVGASYIFTTRFAQKNNLVIAPAVIDGRTGVYLSMNF